MLCAQEQKTRTNIKSTLRLYIRHGLMKQTILQTRATIHRRHRPGSNKSEITSMYKVKVQLETETVALLRTQNVQHSVHPLTIEDVFAARVSIVSFSRENKRGLS